MSEQFLGNRKQALEDAFFHRQEAERIEALRRDLAHKNNVVELKKRTHFTDEELLNELVRLGVTAETLTAVSLVPLIAVAWADGALQGNEKDAILESAQLKGIHPDHPAHELLKSWLASPPGPELMAAWTGYVEALGSSLSSKQLRMLGEQVVALAGDVAKAAGGMLGIKKISAKEQKTLEAIRAAFQTQ